MPAKLKILLYTVLFSFAFLHSAFSFDIFSPVFKSGGFIPDRYTCSSYDFSPPLKWSGVPKDTKSFALICDDPDAPFGIWVHWVIFNIPASARSLKENIRKICHLGNGAMQGINSFGRIGYGGPCPPPGKVHHYYFKLYALDKKILISGKITKRKLISAMKGHILDKAQLIGLYRR